VSGGGVGERLLDVVADLDFRLVVALMDPEGALDERRASGRAIAITTVRDVGDVAACGDKPAAPKRLAIERLRPGPAPNTARVLMGGLQ